MTIFSKVRDLLNKENIDDILITGGGIIPNEDMAELEKIGIGKLFGPGTSLNKIIDYIQTWVAKHKQL